MATSRLLRLSSAPRTIAAALVGATMLLPLAAGSAQAAPSATKPKPTIVSFTFDDGFASQLNAVKILAAHKMHGTFYVNSALLGNPGRLTIANLHSMADAGNEIAGHTLSHSYLPAESKDEQIRDVCNDRLTLTKAGFPVTDFAYPYGAYNSTTEAVVAACGYNSARATGGLGTSPVWSETVPPKDSYAIRAEPSVVTHTTVALVESEISAAVAHGGGWVPLVFHNVCSACGDLAMTQSDFNTLVTWVDAQQTHGVTTRTVAQVIDKPVQPAKAGPKGHRPPAQIINPKLEQTVASFAGAPLSNQEDLQLSTPYCWEPGAFGVNTGTWKRAKVPGTNTWAETVTLTSHSSGDRKLLIRRDEGGCSPSVVTGKQYTLAASYDSNAPVRIVAYSSTSNGRWKFWAASPLTTPTTGWRTISWQTPAIPQGVTNVSFGVALAQVGYVSTTDYKMATYIAHPKGLWAIIITTTLIVIALVVFVVVRTRRIRADREATPSD